MFPSYSWQFPSAIQLRGRYPFRTGDADKLVSLQINIRKAVESDLEAISLIGRSAFSLDPQWRYRYPYAKIYPDDHDEFTRRRYREWLKAACSPECIIMVAETPSAENPSAPTVIGLSIWLLPARRFGGSASDKLQPPVNKIRRDASYHHMAAYRVSVAQARERYFDKRYGNKQLGLAQLATHPEYFKNGVATRLLEWGMDLAKQHDWPITLFASTMGVRLYEKFGFTRLMTIVMNVEGEEDEVDFPGLVWDPREGASKQSTAAYERLVVIYSPSCKCASA